MNKKPLTLRMRSHALDDLQEISAYIARDNPRAAKALVRGIREKCQKLRTFPGMGSERSDIAEGMYHFPVGSYLILYCVTPSMVDVVRIIHAARTRFDV